MHGGVCSNAASSHAKCHYCVNCIPCYASSIVRRMQMITTSGSPTTTTPPDRQFFLPTMRVVSLFLLKNHRPPFERWNATIMLNSPADEKKHEYEN